jgi:hypothetical protein
MIGALIMIIMAALSAGLDPGVGHVSREFKAAMRGSAAFSTSSAQSRNLGGRFMRLRIGPGSSRWFDSPHGQDLAHLVQPQGFSLWLMGMRVASPQRMVSTPPQRSCTQDVSKAKECGGSASAYLCLPAEAANPTVDDLMTSDTQGWRLNTDYNLSAHCALGILSTHILFCYRSATILSCCQ